MSFLLQPSIIIDSESSSSEQSLTQSLPTEQEDPKLMLIPKTDEFLEIRAIAASALAQKDDFDGLKKHIEMVRSEEKKDVYVGLIGVRKALSRGKSHRFMSVRHMAII